MQPTEHDLKMLSEHSEHDADLSTRVTRVEAAVESLTGTMNEVSQSIKHIERSIAAVGKTDMKTLATIGGSIVTVVITIWAILIAPINQQMTDMKEDLAKIDRTLYVYATVPADVLRLEQSDSRQSDKIEAMEKREAVANERARFVEDLVKDLGAKVTKK